MAGFKNALAVLLVHFALADSLDIICYFTNWSQYRPGVGKFFARDIDPYLCTHIIYAFAKLDGPDYSNIIPYEANDEQQWRALNGKKLTNSNLKTLLAIGGWSHGSAPFSAMASKSDARAKFVTNIVTLLRSRNFDGLDIDWEYPADANPEDKQNFALLLKELRARFDQEGAATSRAPLLISAAVSASIAKSQMAYDIPVMESCLDFFNVMTYDYHGPWEKKTGLISPLDALPGDDFSVRETINWYMCQGASRQKLRLGLALFGHTWTLQSPGDNGLGATAIGSGGNPGRFTRTAGYLSTYEICALGPQYIKTLDTLGQVYYSTSNNQFVTFETIDTIQTKLDFLEDLGLHGAMVWAMDLDDIRGETCGESYLSYIRSKILTKPYSYQPNPTAPRCNGPLPQTPPPRTQPTQPPRTQPTQPPRTQPTQPPRTQPTQPPRTQPTQPPRTQPPPGGNYYVGPSSCQNHVGLLADPKSCRQYYACLIFGHATRMNCAFRMSFNPMTLECSDYNCSP